MVVMFVFASIFQPIQSFYPYIVNPKLDFINSTLHVPWNCLHPEVKFFPEIPLLNLSNEHEFTLSMNCLQVNISCPLLARRYSVVLTCNIGEWKTVIHLCRDFVLQNSNIPSDQLPPNQSVMVAILPGVVVGGICVLAHFFHAMKNKVMDRRKQRDIPFREFPADRY